jgi:hypothetical protein
LPCWTTGQDQGIEQHLQVLHQVEQEEKFVKEHMPELLIDNVFIKTLFGILDRAEQSRQTIENVIYA